MSYRFVSWVRLDQGSFALVCQVDGCDWDSEVGTENGARYWSALHMQEHDEGRR